ncbi:hypothetical protein OIDMADRAFT_30934 [Oidiodendron maius Zn]|uniref:Myb-like domain-containing protein n=1 Tax=Oidiodendron maius (strain Zn) TaxID=913774 RepID=A0A0C3GTF4_OIDMZ|nr:hypothetical protein OIDMADRAFT_30934 [Oidiodendron maius Zn]
MASSANNSITRNARSAWVAEEETIISQLTNTWLNEPLVSTTEHWKRVSYALKQCGYRRSANTCRTYWDRTINPRNILAQIARPTWNENQVPSTISIAPGIAPAATFTSVNTSYPNKRSPVNPSSDQNNDWEAGSSHTKRPKRFQVGDMLCQGSVENQSPLSPEVHSDRLQPSLDEVSRRGRVQEQEQRQADGTFYRIPNGGSRMSCGRSVDGAMFPPDPMRCLESQSGLTEQPLSDIVLNTTLKSWQRLPETVDHLQSITVEVEGCEAEQQESTPHFNSTANSQAAEQILTALHPVIKPSETSSIKASGEREQQMAWASRQVEIFEAKIQKLKDDAAKRAMTVTSLDQEIEQSRKDYDAVLHGKQEEIDRVLRELEERHSKEREALKSKIENSNESKQTEIRELKRNASEVSQKEIGLKLFQDIIDYYTPEEGGDN